MPTFTNGKVTSSVIFYDRGIPNTFKSFGYLTTLNYGMMRQIIRNNVENGRQMYSF
jgi:hypothetical protein